MFNELRTFSVGGLSISLYGLTYAIAFAVATGWLLLRAERRAVLAPILHELLLVVVASGYLASTQTKRLLYEPDTAEGTHFLGWAVGSAAAVWVYARLRELEPARLFDWLVPAALLGSAVGRWGCLAAGCCHGPACEPPLGFYFPVLQGHYFPTQILSSAGDATAFALVAARLRRGLPYPGNAALWGVWLYAAFRFPLEWLRTEPRILLGLTPAQLTCLGLVALSLPLRALLAKRGPADS